ncbi:protein transport protein SEC31 [Drosophila elegans]|uniref:protein transport protein SEC31 n=1 Tax=Drosophila elegans TaxID=30023 RepID=UPI0007E740DC|nr:protein transport protein SEC31 [Drosophila elegans]
MGTYRQNLTELMLLYLGTWLLIGLSVPATATATASATGAGEVSSRHRSKRTMTTICVEIRPSSPKDEPYYMCRGANFADGSGQQSCVEVRHQGGEGEPFYMCRGADSTGPGDEFSTTTNPHPAGHNFPFPPAFGGGSYPQQTLPGDPVHQVQPSAGPTTHQEEPQWQPLPQQHQPHAQYGLYGNPMAAHPPASPAQSSGLPQLSQPLVGSPPAATPGATAGPGPTATPPAPDPAAPPRSSNRPMEFSIVGNSRHRFGLEDEVQAWPDAGFRRDALDQQHRQTDPRDQLMWVPLSHTENPENDPVMKAFYSSLSGSGSPTQDNQEQISQASVPVVEPMMGQMASGYSPHNTQYPEAPAPPTLPPPPPTYSYQSEVSPPPNPYCSGCSAPAQPVGQCPTQPDNGVSYSTSCPSFQPVIISMPCYGQRPQPTPYFALPRASPGMGILRSPPMATPFGLDTGPVAGPFGGGGFGMAGQLGSPFGMAPQMGAPGYDMQHQVGGPFGMGMQLGMGLNPFGPFGALNPFNPFNRILAAPAPNVPASNGNLFQRVFNFDQGAEGTSTTEAAPRTEAHSGRTSKLNFSSSTTPSSSDQPDANANVSEARDSSEDEDSAEDIDKDEEPAVTTPLPEADADVSADAPEIQALVSKAAELLKPDKRKRHNPRSSGRVPQKHRYLQQL